MFSVGVINLSLLGGLGSITVTTMTGLRDRYSKLLMFNYEFKGQIQIMSSPNPTPSPEAHVGQDGVV